MLKVLKVLQDMVLKDLLESKESEDIPVTKDSQEEEEVIILEIINMEVLV